MNDKIKIGFIRKAHGLKGEVKILPLTDDPKRFKKLKKLCKSQFYALYSHKYDSPKECKTYLNQN